jgi:hypothetical protein
MNYTREKNNHGLLLQDVDFHIRILTLIEWAITKSNSYSLYIIKGTDCT